MKNNNKKMIPLHDVDQKRATIRVMRDYINMKKTVLTNRAHQQNQLQIQRLAELLNWFERAWEILEPEAQLILSQFYMGTTLKNKAVETLLTKLPYSERILHRKKDRALKELASLLFGK